MDAKVKDSRDRYLRYAEAQPPLESDLYISERDTAVFLAIHYHGLCPSNFLFPFYGTKNWHNFQCRLKLLVRAGYLRRPQRQRRGAYYSHCQHVVYELTPKAVAELAKRELYAPHITHGGHGQNVIHEIMSACFISSVELACKRSELIFIPRQEILKRTRSSLMLPVSTHVVPTGRMYPDELFGIHGNGKKIFYAVEIDRATEQLKENPEKKTTIERKINACVDVLEKRAYDELSWGIPNIRFLYVTTQEARAVAMRSFVPEQWQHKFFFKVLAEFDSQRERGWRVPQEVYADILEPWYEKESAH